MVVEAAVRDLLEDGQLGLLDKYRELEVLLAEVRHQYGTGISDDEETVLSEMDGLWQSMTNAERKAVEANEVVTGDRVEKFRAYVGWLRTNRNAYTGKWIALAYVDCRVELLVVGTDVTEVLQAAWKTVERPFVHYIQTPEELDEDKSTC